LVSKEKGGLTTLF